LDQSGRVSGNGFLKPGAKFPPELINALPFLGRKDNQGRYRLFF
jgi:general secretion pathway protein N